MTADDFDNKEFASLDEVDVIMSDGKKRREYLHQGHAERKDFSPDEILIIGGEAGYGISEINLADVRDVILITRVV